MDPRTVSTWLDRSQIHQDRSSLWMTLNCRSQARSQRNRGRSRVYFRMYCMLKHLYFTYISPQGIRLFGVSDMLATPCSMEQSQRVHI